MRWAHLALLLPACAPAAGSVSPNGEALTPAPALAVASKPEPEAAPCPVVDFADLEPKAHTPDARTVALDRIFESAERREALGKAARYRLGKLRVSEPEIGPAWRRGVGMGWMGLEPAWVDATLSPGLRGPFESWIAARERLGELQRASYLLDTRVRYARSVAAPESWGGLTCVEQAASRVELDLEKAEADTEQAATGLLASLRAQPSLTAGDSMLLGYLLEARLPYPRDPTAADLAEALALFTALSNDARVDRELRARAAEALARTQPSTEVKAFRAALERVLTLTRDPELRVETLIKLADTAEDPRVAEKLRSKIIEQIDGHESGWRLAQTLSARAQNRLERGADALALRDAARCARESPNDFPRDPDPWGCAPILAEALAQLARAPDDAVVPLSFLGPLALASMNSALDRFDHDQARRVGTLLLDLSPDAAEVPQVLDMLISLAATPADRARLTEIRSRDYGPESTWSRAQRERLAWKMEPEAVETQLVRLTSTTRRGGVRWPNNQAEFEAQLRQRARQVSEVCAGRLGRGARVGVRVDTTGPIPGAAVSGTSAAGSRCVKRSVRAEFRSVGSAKIDFEIVVSQVTG